MKKMLVTGASGFLGSRVAGYYKNKYEVLTPSHSDMDITDEQSVREYFIAHRPHIVVHCAAMSDVGTCEREPEKSWKVNVIGTENIVKCAKEIQAKCICCSSDQVYCAVESREPNLEDTPVCPSNVYGKEKLYTEQSCLNIYPESIHLRLSWMYDANDKRRMDFIKQMKCCCERTNDICFSAKDKRGITDVWEVVKNIELLSPLPGGVYNFGSPNDKSTFETVRKVFEIKGYDSSLVKELGNANFRNLTMSQKKVNPYGIYFSDTIEGVLREWNDEI